MDNEQNIIIYRTADGKASVALYAKDSPTSVAKMETKMAW